MIMMMMFMTHQFGLNLLFKLLYLLMNLELVLNTDGQRSHIFSVSVSSISTSSTTSMWRFSSSILISSSSILTSASSSVLSRISDDETTLVTVMEGPRCGAMILILIVMDDGGHPFPMDVDGRTDVTTMMMRMR